jgi:SEC-C motif-containing protein
VTGGAGQSVVATNAHRDPCPCGSARDYPDCCGALHSGTRSAATAQELMRSRYSAFAVHDAAYLLRTWHPATRPPELRFDDGLRWTGLTILGTTGGSLLHTEGTVDFEARYVERGRAGAMREHSRFQRVDGNWLYVAPRED